jgi:hypothetical protein
VVGVGGGEGLPAEVGERGERGGAALCTSHQRRIFFNIIKPTTIYLPLLVEKLKPLNNQSATPPPGVIWIGNTSVEMD